MIDNSEEGDEGEKPEDSRDSLEFTPQMLLDEALQEINTDPDMVKAPPTKMLIIYLWDDDGAYHTRFRNAGMSASECIALLEIMKQRFVRSILG